LPSSLSSVLPFFWKCFFEFHLKHRQCRDDWLGLTSFLDRHCSDDHPDPNFPFYADLDPDPEGVENDADPDVDPTTSLTHVGKSDKNL